MGLTLAFTSPLGQTIGTCNPTIVTSPLLKAGLSLEIGRRRMPNRMSLRPMKGPIPPSSLCGSVSTLPRAGDRKHCGLHPQWNFSPMLKCLSPSLEVRAS